MAHSDEYVWELKELNNKLSEVSMIPYEIKELTASVNMLNQIMQCILDKDYHRVVVQTSDHPVREKR